MKSRDSRLRKEKVKSIGRRLRKQTGEANGQEFEERYG
jgi:hypothetical protein